ncbi:MAG: cytochrome c maturation protein CcmE [Chloroflexi bacterium]|nr:cytochrome c maturation protein CcmE [Chloroflexota bacterium]
MATTIPRVQERQGFNIRWRYVIIIAILVPVLAHVFFAITRSPLTNYYVTVDELVAQSAQTSKVRVGGLIVPGTINWDNATRSLTFQLQGEKRNLTVTYRGFAPDTFRDGSTAIVEGELSRDGTFTAYNLLIKCPHQYVPAM